MNFETKTSVICDKTIQAELSPYGRLYYQEFGQNLLEIHLVLDFPKTG